MKHGFVAALAAVMTMAMVPSFEAEAKRVGGARSTGVQRQTPTQPIQKQQPDAPAATPGAAPAAAGTAAAAAAPAAAAAAKRNWTGPLMGLAAGLGLAALFSSMGMGEGFSSFMMIMLLALVGFALFRFIMSRFAGRGRAAGTPGLAAAAAGAAGGTQAFGNNNRAEPSFTTQRNTVDGASSGQGLNIGSALTPPLAVPGLNTSGSTTSDAAPLDRRLPADFDTAAFERIAKTIFIRLQAANDERNLDDLRAFSTPEMFAELRTDLLERGTDTQQTEVLSVNSTIVDFADEGDHRVVSVRYVGVIRESVDGAAESFDEVWHLVQANGSPAWRIAGIQQNA